MQANSSASSQGHHYKSYSLTGPSASQLSQSVRDRLMLGSQSLPKPGSPEFTALFAAAHHRERGAGAGPVSASFSPRVLKPSDGSLSDTCSNYAAPDLQGYYASSSPYTTSWMRHSNTYTPSGRSQGNLTFRLPLHYLKSLTLASVSDWRNLVVFYRISSIVPFNNFFLQEWACAKQTAWNHWVRIARV